MVSAFPKCDVKRGSRSVISLVGRPNHRYTCSRYNWAIPTPVIVVEQGRNMVLREHPWSTIVSMASWTLSQAYPQFEAMTPYSLLLTTGALEAPYSYPVPLLSQGWELPNCISNTCIDGLDSPPN